MHILTEPSTIIGILMCNISRISQNSMTASKVFKSFAKANKRFGYPCYSDEIEEFTHTLTEGKIVSCVT